MIKIYRLTPEMEEKGSWEHGFLKTNNKIIEISEEELIKKFGRGYWRCRKS